MTIARALSGGTLAASLFLSSCQSSPTRTGAVAFASNADLAPSLGTTPLRWSAGQRAGGRAAVLIAADQYESSPAWGLPGAAASASTVRTMLVEHCAFPADAVAIVAGPDVTADRVESAILAAGRRLRGAAAGLLWVYFCGHGRGQEARDASGQAFVDQHLFTYLTREDGGHYDKTIARSQVLRWMAQARAEAAGQAEAVLVVDACRRNVGDPAPRARLVDNDVWEIHGVTEGQFVAAGDGGEAFAFTRALTDAVTALATTSDEVDIDRVFREASARTLTITGKQQPQMQRPAKAARAPAVVLHDRVRFVVRVVDALSGVALPHASLVFDDQSLTASEGTAQLSASASEHLLSVRVADYLPRTERLLLTSEHMGATVEVPLPPALTLLRGVVTPPCVVKVRALCDGARPGYHVLEATTDDQGRFELRVPRLTGTRVDVVQEGRVIAPVALPGAPDSLTADAAGQVEGIGVANVRAALPASAVARPTEAPEAASDFDRVDWERALRMIDAGRYDLAREAAAQLGSGTKLARWQSWLDSRWVERELQEGLRAGKEQGEWARADGAVKWWKWGAHPLDNQERVRALVAEHAREHMTIDVRRRYEAANAALADGRIEEALAGYQETHPRLTLHYQAVVQPQIERLRVRLYERHMNAGTQAEVAGKPEDALAAYGKAMAYNVRARAAVSRLLVQHPRLTETPLGRQLATAVPTVTEADGGDRVATGIGLTMRYVEPQEFTMGSPAGEPGSGGREQRHTVKITKGYWLGETEVTQGQWKAVMGTEPWKGQIYKQEGSHIAATYVSWSDALKFCRRLTEREHAAGRLPEGYRYVLPTEAEWELACRARTTTAYCFGDDPSELGAYGVFGQARSGEHAHVVKQQRCANPWGFFDMHGNVWEWCLDACEYKGGVVTDTYRDGLEDPYNQGGPRRVVRGGSWLSTAPNLRSASRISGQPGSANFDLGFRPALAARAEVQ